VTFIEPDIIDDETEVAEGILAGLADRIEGFSPVDGHLEAPISEATAVAIATAIVVLKDTVLDAYLGFGQRLLGIPRGAAGVATAVSTWTVDATQIAPEGILAGTEVQITPPSRLTSRPSRAPSRSIAWIPRSPVSTRSGTSPCSTSPWAAATSPRATRPR
jgi:hypothetical protein